MDDVNVLHSIFTDEKSYETVSDDNQFYPTVNFVTKNKDNEYFFGVIWTEKEKLKEGNYQEDLNQVIVASAWNRKNDKNYTRQPKADQNIAHANGNDFSIGNSWKNVRSWQQNTYWTDFGSLVEWRAGYYLTNPSDNKNYYAVAIESGMSPKNNCQVILPGNDDSYCASDRLTYWSQANAYNQQNLLKSYAPKSTPSSNTVSFSIGGNYSKSSGASGSIGASYSVSRSDLDILDQSNLMQQKAEIQFNYKYFLGLEASKYAKGTSWQNLAIIYQGVDNATYCNFQIGKKASFYKRSGIQYKNAEQTGMLDINKS